MKIAKNCKIGEISTAKYTWTNYGPVSNVTTSSRDNGRRYVAPDMERVQTRNSTLNIPQFYCDL